MDHKDLFTHSGFTTLAGRVLTVEEKAHMQSSLSLLHRDYRFCKTVYWGRIDGIKNEYHIAQGYPGSLLGKKVSFYSTDKCVTWNQLMEVQPDEEVYLKQIRGMFLGDPSFSYVFNRTQEHIDAELQQIEEKEKRIEMEELKKKQEEEEAKVAETHESESREGQEEGAAADSGGDEANGTNDNAEGNENDDEENGEDDDEQEQVKEEKKKDEKEEVPKHMTLREDIRLSYAISLIDQDTNVVPRGSYVMNASEDVVVNETFSGLANKDAISLYRYMHLRTPVNLPLKTLLEKDHLNVMLDFADTVDEDGPGQPWSLQYDDAFDCVVGRSLLWPGYVFFHVPNTRTFGSFYMGTGEKNMDLCFMMPYGSQ